MTKLPVPKTLYVRREDEDGGWLNACPSLEDFTDEGEILVYELVKQGEIKITAAFVPKE